jgi:aryl-alcohol dehydrogenase-like predicted oxidoreductase
MEYRVLRGTGATVSRVCLGTMTFGQQADEATSARMVNQAIDAGVNFIDTADAYVGGTSEEILGRAIKGRRDGLVIASKVCNQAGPNGPRDGGLHRWHVVRGVEACLRRLQIDCLDICYLHKPDRNTPIEESLAAFDTLVQQGKVNYVAMSNFSAWQMMEARMKAEINRWSKPVVMQVPYNLITRSIDEECVEFSEYANMGMCVYNPLGAGFLTGKHEKHSGPVPGSRFDINIDYHGRFWQDANFEALDQLKKIAEGAGVSLIELSLRWLATKDFVDSVIMGASKPEHLEANIKAIDGRLDDETMGKCDAVWSVLRGGHFQYNR